MRERLRYDVTDLNTWNAGDDYLPVNQTCPARSSKTRSPDTHPHHGAHRLTTDERRINSEKSPAIVPLLLNQSVDISAGQIHFPSANPICIDWILINWEMHSVRARHDWQMSLLGGNTAENYWIRASYCLFPSVGLSAVISFPPEDEPQQKILISVSSFTFRPVIRPKISLLALALEALHLDELDTKWGAAPEAFWMQGGSVVGGWESIKLFLSRAHLFDLIGLMRDGSGIYQRNRWAFVPQSSWKCSRTIFQNEIGD